MDNAIISLKNISKSYPGSGKRAVSNISLEIKKSEFFCLVGPSGCGKSTLLKLIAGLELPTVGEINKPANVSMVFQSAALFPWLSVEDNAGFGLKMEGFHPKIIGETVHKYLEMMGLSELKKRYPSELSGGQKQRVGIARALAVNPEVLLLDEPFSALDLLTTEELEKDLAKIWQDTGKTIVMVSHSLAESVLLADRIGVVVSGSLQGIVNINLPRPRHNEQAGFTDLVNQTKKLFRIN